MIPVRVVVVGGGVIGLLTAMECVRAGALVDVVDQSDIPSRRSTSYDRHRVVRALHRGDAALTLAAGRAHQGWLDVEQRLGTRFYHQVGALTAMAARDAAANLAMLAAAGAPARELAPAQLSARYPQIRFPAGATAVLEPAAGAILADQALLAMARWLADQPAVRLLPGRRVTDIDQAGTVRLAGGEVLAADRVVVAAGPWSRALLPAALGGDLTLYRQTMLSYAPRPSGAAWAGLPAMVGLGADYRAWLMPPVAGTPARLSAIGASRAVTAMTDRATPDQWRDYLTGQFSTLLADFDHSAVVGAADGYYLADSRGAGPLLASLAGGSVWAYAACGGMSFKFAPLIACAVADRATGRPPRLTGLDSVDRPREFTAARSEEPA